MNGRQSRDSRNRAMSEMEDRETEVFTWRSFASENIIIINLCVTVQFTRSHEL